jgi:hypothetical protein
MCISIARKQAIQNEAVAVSNGHFGQRDSLRVRV